MQLIAQLKLQPTPAQKEVLDRTLRTANAACQWLSEHAWRANTFGRRRLQREWYYDLRSRFPLSAQMTIRVIAKVAEAYASDHKQRKRNKREPRTEAYRFQLRGAFPYDRRILSWKLPARTVSIWTLAPKEARQRIPFQCGAHQARLLPFQHGETDLAYRDGAFYLLTTCQVAEVVPQEPTDFLGVDVGLRNIAYDSDGHRHSGTHALSLRHRHRRLRQRLQQKGTTSAKRLLRKRSRRERRFMANMNHCVSKQLVATAKDTQRGIALEDLTGIRRRVSVRHRQRATLHSWAFWQLRAFIAYKAQRAGVAVVFVDPRWTSQRCPKCETIDKGSRKSRDWFLCIQCGFAGPADHVAAENIRWAAVNQPHAARVEAKAPPRSTTRPRRRPAVERSCKPSA
jgi:IS605 OrfB family transposase